MIQPVQKCPTCRCMLALDTVCKCCAEPAEEIPLPEWLEGPSDLKQDVAMTPISEIGPRVDSLEARALISRHEIASLIAWVRLERNARKLSVALLLVAVNVALSRYVHAAIAGLAIGTAALAAVFRVMSYLEARDDLKQMGGPPFGADLY